MWNADRPEGIRLEDGKLYGGKAFASGAGILSHAVVSVDVLEGRQLLIIDLGQYPPSIDRSWWQMSGMQRTETHLVWWDGAALPVSASLGSPADYIREPWFSGGALRFAAAQAGGIAALVDGVRGHLVETGRADNALQRVRLAHLYRVAQAAADAVGRAAAAWNVDDIEATLSHVAAARWAVYHAGEEALTLAQAAVGLSAMFLVHPLNAAINDLTVYLRQPAPDAQAERIAAAIVSGSLYPML